MTVTNIISEFIQNKLVVECEEELTEVCGRNPILLKISEQAPKVIGLLIFRDRIEAVICSLILEIIAIESIHFNHLTREELIEDCFIVIDRLLKKGENILEHLKNKYALPIFLDYDNNSAALVSVVNVLQPEMIVLGHDCIDWDDRYVRRLEKLVNEKQMVRDNNQILVKKVHFGKKAQLVGAAANVADQVFRGDLLF